MFRGGLRRKIKKLSLGIVLFVILPLICVEFLMIVFDPVLFKDFYQYDPDLGFRVRAYYPIDGVLTNQFGFNDRDYPLTKTPGTFRVLVLGDSFSWAEGRDGNYTALVERRFEDLYGSHKIDVINAGYPGTHTGEQLAMLKKYGLQYDPDLVVLGFFVGNDFIDAEPNRKRIVVNGVPVDISRSEEHRILGYPMINQSRLLLFLQRKYKIFRELRKAGSEGGNLPDFSKILSEQTFLDIERSRLEFFNLNASRQGSFQPNIDCIFRSISEMDALLRSRNIKFVVAVYPDEFQCNENLQNMLFEKFGLRREDYDLDLAQNLLKSFLASKGIASIDLLDPFRQAAGKQPLYLLRNTHWNAAGNQLAADILFEDLVKRIDQVKSLPAN